MAFVITGTTSVGINLSTKSNIVGCVGVESQNVHRIWLEAASVA